MTTKESLTRILALAISIALVAVPLAAQKRKDAQPALKEAARAQREAPTFDNLLAADDYKIYGEIKNVGQLIRSPNVADFLDPVMKLASPPKEFKSLVKFANAHAELLSTSRMFFAAWPARPKLPQALFGIEFSSAEEAGKFEPQLRAFLPTILPPPTPSPTSGEAVTPGKEDTAPSPEPKQSATAEIKSVDTKPAALPFVIKVMGNLVLISDTAFSLKNLRPANSELLFDNPNFRQAHDRFGSEQIFLFFNVALDARKRMGISDSELSELQKQSETPMVEETPAMPDNPQPEPVEAKEMADAQIAELQSESPEELTAITDPNSASQEQQAVVFGESSGPQAGTGPGPQMDWDLGLGLMFGNLFGGNPKWPEAFGVAIALESDTYTARVLMVGGLNGKPSPVPFISQWVSGPALTLESPSIMPFDTELFVAASLDTPQIYEGLVKTMNEQAASFQRVSRQPHNETPPATPFAALEKKLGLKIKEDLLPVLGNEIAVSVPVTTFTGKPAATAAPSPGASESDKAAAKKHSPNPIVLISLKDKEAAHTLVPRIIEGLGFKGAGMLAQRERRDDTEIVSYAGVFSYAFVGNFLVLSLDAATTTHVVDSYLITKRSRPTVSSETPLAGSLVNCLVRFTCLRR
ncbi:MAG TPA: hypothetical protein VN920_15130 [Pyrinomonadaceae bacterium]|nr:hypothetical protein [Pyrinomonadaceae bacterium]